ncbi:endonuclease/exonuclease/phosphatase family protein [Oceanibium sediminis]|uniref:endonuclease/exonuclease/phosphatase family protein n=1 Tax=Oceanibium sediminis TaxID=2026339 RepID=UPI000DD319DD|nr:endonuclease/exonuclease/phosphatase family protein [Oceanibium sediminis]
MLRSLLLAALAVLSGGAGMAETVRVASFNASLSRTAPGILLRDIERGEDPQVAAVIKVLQEVRPDILLLSEFDYDAGGFALEAFAAQLAAGPNGLSLPHTFLDEVNTGQPSGFDLNRDGKTYGPADAHAYGLYPGHEGMAVLSRFPIDASASHRFRLLRWSSLDWADLPRHADGTPYPSAEAQAALRLSHKAHWDLAVDVAGQPLRLFVSHPTPPVFDGPEDRNGRRNHDEITFWSHYLNGASFPSDAGATVSRGGAPFVILGDLNADPEDGDGRRGAIRALLADPLLQDPAPESAGGRAAALSQGGANVTQRGDPARDTADWDDTGRGPGNMRVDYVLPDARLSVTGSGVYWPEGESAATAASSHRLVWVDLDF